MGDVFVAQGKLGQALEQCTEAIRLADDSGDVKHQHEARSTLALAQLLAGELAAARDAAEAALRYDFPLGNHSTLALLGVIALSQEDLLAAQEVSTRAVEAADRILNLNTEYYSALDSKGLALCTLTLCGENNHISTAMEAYQAARRITKAAGVVRRAQLVFDALAMADSEGLLDEVRRVAAGE
jgi:tetratricopeptide (TPR) repeat protein